MTSVDFSKRDLDVIYLPIIFNDKRMRWWDKENEYLYYPYTLVTPGSTRLKSYPNIKDDVEVFADSGGWQLIAYPRKYTVDPLSVLNWQEKHADIGFTLDYPPHASSDGIQFYKYSHFKDCMAKSTRNAEMMREHKTRDDFKLWGVIQGKNFKHMKEWYEHLTRNYEFEGYCLVSSDFARNQSMEKLYGIIRMLYYLEDVPRVHVLGTSAPLILLILSRIAQETDQQFTVDSISLWTGGKYGNYYNPLGVSQKHRQFMFTRNEDRRQEVTKLPCDCPVCMKHSAKELYNSYWLRNYHNLFVILRRLVYFNAIATNDELFRRHLQSLIGEKHFDRFLKLIVDREEIEYDVGKYM